MFASDSICLSTYSNVSCDCWGKAWRPNVALFSYNSNEVQSDKNPNSFNCWPRSGCPYCPSALVSVSACRYAPHFSTSASARTSRAGQGSCHVLVFWSVTFFTCPPASSPTMFTLSIHRSDSSQDLLFPIKGNAIFEMTWGMKKQTITEHCSRIEI